MAGHRRAGARADSELLRAVLDSLVNAVLAYLTDLRTWEIVGWVAQGTFASRFLVQWILSERAKRSYVPIVFWYLSLTGGTLMLLYALNIQAWPIVIGQATGVLVYGRNLLLIYRERRTVPAPPAPQTRAPETLTHPPGPFAGQVTVLASSDLDRAHRFYAERLGLPLVLDQGDRRFYRVSRDSAVGLRHDPDASAARPAPSLVTLVTPDVDGWAERLQAAGVPLDAPPRTDERLGQRSCALSDPDGHRIELKTFLDPTAAAFIGAPETP